MERMGGILGCGMIAGHLPAIGHVSGLQLHAVYDVNWNRGLAMQSRFGIPHAFPAETPRSRAMKPGTLLQDDTLYKHSGN